MAKQRYVNTKFWSDGFIAGLDPLARYLFLYFLTNEHTNISGIYELSRPAMERESGLDYTTINNIVQGFDDRLYYFEECGGWVCLRNFIKHQIMNQKVKVGIQKSLGLIPPQILAKIKEKNENFYNEIIDSDRLSIAYDSLSKPMIGSELLKLESKFKRKEGVVATPPDGGDSTTHTDSDLESFNPKAEIKKLYDSKKLHERIIGLFLDHRNFVARNQEHFNLELRKHVRAASSLAKLDYGPDFYGELFKFTDVELKKGNNPLADDAVNLATPLKYAEKFRSDNNIE